MGIAEASAGKPRGDAGEGDAALAAQPAGIQATLARSRECRSVQRLAALAFLQVFLEH